MAIRKKVGVFFNTSTFFFLLHQFHARGRSKGRCDGREDGDSDVDDFLPKFVLVHGSLVFSC